jgi:D-sedoheptulose 7-phosphate isomerase
MQAANVKLNMQNFFKTVETAETSSNGKQLPAEKWLNEIFKVFKNLNKNKKSIFFIGNGASCAMASHFALDFTKNGKIKSFSCNDAALVTCFNNDFSFENSYKEILKHYMSDGDALIAISSLGKSKNIVNAANFVKTNLKKSSVITFSGGAKNNPLCKAGNFNLYVNSNRYGTVEPAHYYYLHLLLDLWIIYKNNAAR